MVITFPQTRARRIEQPPSEPSRRRPYRASPLGAPYLLALPFLILFALFFLAPIGYAVWDSLHKRVRDSGIGFGRSTEVFAGLENYRKVFADPAFLRGVLRVLGFGVVQVPIMLGLALVLALVMDSGKAKFVGFFRVAAFLPYAVPGVVAAILWGFLYSPGISPVADLLERVGFTPVDFLGDDLALWSIGNIVTWSWTGYNMLIIFSSLRGIPQQVLEAARVDGASEWQVALHVKVPLVMPALVLTGVFSVIGTLQLFTEPSVLSKLSGAVDSGYTPNLLAYNAAFTTNNTHYAAAISVVLALITFVLSFALLRFTSRRALEA